MTTENLWGDLPDGEGIKTPYSILKEQITFLEQGTKGLLTGVIARDSQSETTILTLNIVAPALNNYSFQVTDVRHHMSLYPVNVFNSTRRGWIMCNDENAFLLCLSEILKSPQIKSVISGLLAQIKAETA